MRHGIRQFGIGLRLALGFGAILLLMTVGMVGGNLLYEMRTVELTTALRAANEKVVVASAMKGSILEGAVATRNIGLQTDVAATQREAALVKEHSARYEASRAQLVGLGLTPEEKRIVETISEADAIVRTNLDQAVAQGLMFNQEGATRIIVSKIDPPSQRMVAEINKLVALQQAAVARTVQAGLEQAQRLRMLGYGLGLAAVLLAIGCAVVLTRSITTPLQSALAQAKRVASGRLDQNVIRSGADEVGQVLNALATMTEGLRAIVTKVRAGTDSVHTASGELARANLDLSRRTESQASFLEETASALEELTSAVQKNADSSKEANKVAVLAADVARRGVEAITKVATTMDTIKSSSAKIEAITANVEGIAFQTNILALNAAVEAARAGEAGRGFAVVAAEVRSLAQRSALAAKETKALITQSTDEIEVGHRLITSSRTTISEIVVSAERVTTIVSDIAAASEEQRAGIVQVNQALAQMESTTQQNAAMVEEAAAVSGSLREQAQELAATVSAFVLDSRSPREAAKSSPPAPPALAGRELRMISRDA